LRFLAILSLSAAAALVLGGCGTKEYTHDLYGSDGRITQHYRVSVVESPFVDFSAQTSSLTLPDGSVWNLNAPATKADPAATAAAQTLGTAAIDWALTAMKLGVVP